MPFCAVTQSPSRLCYRMQVTRYQWDKLLLSAVFSWWSLKGSNWVYGWVYDFTAGLICAVSLSCENCKLQDCAVRMSSEWACKGVSEWVSGGISPWRIPRTFVSVTSLLQSSRVNCKALADTTGWWCHQSGDRGGQGCLCWSDACLLIESSAESLTEEYSDCRWLKEKGASG